jgi:hypothetical protein
MSYCRCCRYYEPEGQRGGFCQLLDAPVKGGWTACHFAASPFGCSYSQVLDESSLLEQHPLTFEVKKSQLASLELSFKESAEQLVVA